MRSLSIRFKVVALVMLVLLCCGAALIGLVYRHSVRLTGSASLATSARVFEEMESADVARLAMSLEAIEHIESLREAFLARDRDRLYALAAPIFAEFKKQHRVTHWYFHDKEGVCFLRVHQRETFGDKIQRATLLAAMSKNQLSAGKELGKTAFAVRVVTPYRGADGQTIGYLELGEEIDHYLTAMHKMTLDEYALVIDKSFLDGKTWAATRNGKRNGWDDHPALVVVDETSPELGVDLGWTPSKLPARGQELSPVVEGGRSFLRGIYPVQDAMGRVVGGLFVMHDTTAVQRGLLSGGLGAALGGLVTLVILLTALVSIMNHLVFSRLTRMVTRLEDVSTRLAGGDYDVGGEMESEVDDEVGRFETFFGKFLQMVGAALKSAEKEVRRAG
ncbi:MAG TPA: cache domain-containing protein [Anaeromyxobacter sp.]|nr:cache domain-containing protein [Anaeromyxobacter sp.]